ncbi:glucosyltransferase [Ciborinia camelliae]|nr:glucosyltransferase [Ciborinia camelliae]
MAGAISTLLVGVLTAVGGSDFSSYEGLNRKTAIAVSLTVASIASFWEYQVTKNVPEPYLQGERSRTIGSWETWKNHAWFYLCGVLALCMRQTNIFWAAIFLGGMEAVRSMKGTYRLTAPSFRHLQAPTQEEFLKQYCELAKSEHPHDPPLHEAYLEDFILTPLSILWTAINRLPTILLRLIPHISLIITFAAFVYINGGVVLGDKSNHVATIHLPQLLYLWPFIAFFSFPLLLPALFSFISSTINHILHPSKFLTSSLHSQLRALIISALVLASLLGSLVIIKYNTIIHPFTLADNRHYVFYVFRYTILRHPVIRYLLAPIYIGCFYLIFQTLAGCTFPSSKPLDPSNPDPIPTEWQTIHELSSFSNPMREHASSRLLSAWNEATGVKEDEDDETRKNHDFSSTRSKTTPAAPTTIPLTTLLLLLLTTALSLITAPLVEPRYFILPFIFLRLHFPPSTSSPSSIFPSPSPPPPTPTPTLTLETLWYLLINLTTGYIFLHRGFEWVQEPGRVQRFMW